MQDDHSSDDGTLIKAWASMKSFQPEPNVAPPDDEGPGQSAPDDQTTQPKTEPMPSPSRPDRNAKPVS